MFDQKLRYNPDEKSFDYLIRTLKGTKINEYEFSVDVESNNANWFIYEKPDFRVLAVRCLPKVDYSIDSIQNTQFDYIVRFFTRDFVIKKENQKDLKLSLPNGYVILKKGDHVIYNLKEDVENYQVALSFNKDRLSDELIKKIDSYGDNLYYTGNDTFIAWHNSFRKEVRDQVEDKYSEDWIKLKFKELEILFHSSLKALKVDDEDKKFFHHKDIEAIYQIRDNITQNLKEKPVLKELSKEYGLNVNKLTLLFKELVGTTIYNFYKKERLAMIRKLIVETDTPFGEIAYDYNFTDISHFSKSCIAAFGMSPSAMRQNK